MKILHYLLLFLLILNLSCKQNSVDTNAVKTINLIESKDILPISTFIKKIEYVKLQIPKTDYEVGEVVNVKFIDDDIVLIHQKAKEIDIVRFSGKGEFINVVVSSTKGIVSEPIDIIKYENDFAVLGKSGIYIFSKTGDFKKQIVNEIMHGNSFYFMNNRFYVLNPNTAHNFINEYQSGNFGQPQTANNYIFENVGFARIIPQKNESFSVVTALNDTVFEYGKTGKHWKYIFEGNNYPTLMSGVKQIVGMERIEAKKFMNNNQHIVVKNYLENSSYIYLTYWAGSTSVNLLVNKKSQDSTYFYYGVNNIDGGIWEQPITITNANELVVPISTAKISAHIIKNKKRKDFERLQQNIKSTDGLVLMKCKLK